MHWALRSTNEGLEEGFLFRPSFLVVIRCTMQSVNVQDFFKFRLSRFNSSIISYEELNSILLSLIFFIFIPIVILEIIK